MKKKLGKTYSQMAKAIIKKYEPRLGKNGEKHDPLAEASMQKELDELAERQENAKAIMAQQQFGTMGEQPMMAHGGYIPQAAYGGDLVDPTMKLTVSELANARLHPNYVGATKIATPGSIIIKPPVTKTYTPAPVGTINIGSKPRITSTPPKEIYTPRYAGPQPDFDDVIPSYAEVTYPPEGPMFTPPTIPPRMQTPVDRSGIKKGGKMRKYTPIVPCRRTQAKGSPDCYAEGGELILDQSPYTSTVAPMDSIKGQLPLGVSAKVNTNLNNTMYSDPYETPLGKYGKILEYPNAPNQPRLMVSGNGGTPLSMSEWQELSDRQQMQFGNTAPKKAYGGRLPRMDRGGGIDPKLIPTTPRYAEFEDTNPINYYPSAYDMSASGPENQQYFKEQNYFKPIDYTKTNQPANNTSWWSSIPTESKIGAGIQGATALAQMALALGNKPKNISYNPTQAPDYIPITNDEQLRQSNLAYMDAERAMRSASPSMYYAGMSKLASDRARSAAGIAEQTANINAQGMNQNAWQKAALNQSNEQMRNRMQMYNNEQGNQYMQNIATGIGNIGNVGAGAMKDLNAYKSEQAALGFMDQPGYGHTYVGSTLVSTVRPAPGFEHYKDPKTNKMVYEHLGKKLKDAKEYNSKLMEWKSKNQ